MCKTTMIGCDLHDRSMLLRIAVDQANPIEKKFVNDAAGRDKMAEFLISFSRERKAERIIFAYEASGQGFGLHDLLHEYGIECCVLSPTHLPQTRKRRLNKTDPKDAQMIFEHLRGHVLAGNDLAVVWAPPQRLRDDRELVRARLETAEACTDVKLQIFSLLKRYGVQLPGWFQRSRNWTNRFMAWLRENAENLVEEVSAVLLSYVERVDVLNCQTTQLDKRLRILAKTPRYRDAYEALTKIKGVGLVTALVFLTEMGDLSRFANRRQVASYLGLCPAAHESGDADDRKGHITRQGPGRVRKVLCQASWAGVRTDKDTREDWERIRGGKPKQGKKAIVAIMRKLGIKMWHIALEQGVSGELVAPPPPEPHWLKRADTEHSGSTVA